MSQEHTVRAWKDRRYRRGLQQDGEGRMPAHPSGLVEVDDERLANVAGNTGPGVPTINTMVVGCTYFLCP